MRCVQMTCVWSLDARQPQVGKEVCGAYLVVAPQVSDDGDRVAAFPAETLPQCLADAEYPIGVGDSQCRRQGSEAPESPLTRYLSVHRVVPVLSAIGMGGQAIGRQPLQGHRSREDVVIGCDDDG